MHNENHFSKKVLKAFDKAKKYIDEHTLEWKSPDWLAAYAGIARGTLQSIFRYKTGGTISDYWEIMRIETACTMLTEGELIIKEIATKCGYNNQSNFSNVFRKVKNVSPTEWQKTGGNGSPGEQNELNS